MPPGQIEFGTYERGTPELKAAYATIAETYDPENVDALDAFADCGRNSRTDIPVCR